MEKCLPTQNAKEPKINFKDMLSSGKGTEYIINSINLDAKVPNTKFTKAALRK